MGTSHRILVVDDSVDLADTLAMLLESQGHEVHTANDGPKAIEEARSFKPQIVFLDIGLPDMDGFEVCEKLRGNFDQKMMLIALTGYGEEQIVERAKKAGFDHHLLKPVDLDTLEGLLASFGS